MQFITGGRALKIVRECSVPFIISQSRPIRETGYDDIVVPLDLHQDTKQKLAIVAEMATVFQWASSASFRRLNLIEFFAESIATATWSLPQTTSKDRGIEYTTKISEHDSSAFVKDVTRHAASIEADLISIMNFHEKEPDGNLGHLLRAKNHHQRSGKSRSWC